MPPAADCRLADAKARGDFALRDAAQKGQAADEADFFRIDAHMAALT
jgi:hypothetical protein